MNDDSTLSIVVFPVPVPPLTTTFSRPRTQASMKCAACAVIVPKFDQVVDLVRVGGEPPDRHERPADRERVDDAR